MSTQKKWVEALFISLTRFIIKFRIPVLLIVLALSIALALQIRFLTIDTSNEGMLRPNDPILINYNAFRDQFGRDDLLVLAIQSDTIFSIPFLEKLKKFHEQLEERVPHITEITSLVNGRDTRGKGDTLLVDDLLVDLPKTDTDLAALKERVMSNPNFINMLVSEDGTFTTVLLRSDTYSAAGAAASDDLAGFDDEAAGKDEPNIAGEKNGVIKAPDYLTDEENTEIIRMARAVVKEFNSPDFKIMMAGSPVVTHTVKQMMMADMKRFLRLAVLTIGICLFFMFRRISGVVMPLIIVALTLTSTLGLMARLGVFFKTPTIILPSFLLAVGVGASVHVLSLVYQYLRTDSSKNDAIIHAYGHSGLAIVMTSLTTAAGLASFAAAKVAPIADLGLFSAIGVILSLFYTIILLPGLLAIFPLKEKAQNKKNHITLFDRFLDWVADITTSRSKLIVMIALIGIAISLAGIPKLQFSHNLLSWLPKDLPVRTATESIDHHLRGSVALEVVLDTGRENGLYDRDLLIALNRLTKDLEQFKQGGLFVGKTIAVTTILKEIHKALNENRPEMYKIPDNKALIPQEFLLFENSGSDDLQDVVDTRFQQARISIKVPWRDALSYVPFIKAIEKRFTDAFASLEQDKRPVSVTTTGIMSLFARILYATMYSAAQSYGIALVVITIMMILLIGNLRLGLIAMIPNLGPILIVMGIMGWFRIPLDMFTMMIASVAIGLAVDDTVHFIYNFKRYYTESGDVRDAVGHTLHTAGRAMLATSIVLSVGFFIFMFASMNNVFYFGLLIGMAIILALIGDFFLGPALMALFAEKMLGRPVVKQKSADPTA
ncbi:MAG: RND transporter [Deltaproteobacteria bacterium]|nr:MAG: RND transporter [Deltaproteobacteria bacterium]